MDILEDMRKKIKPSKLCRMALSDTKAGTWDILYPMETSLFFTEKDTQIMIYGTRVEISEVESRLYQCKGVSRLGAGKKIVNWLIQQALKILNFRCLIQ